MIELEKELFMKSDLAGAYRPKTLDDVVGQEVVVTTLKNAFERNNLHHAYLLVGQFGSGKTSVARILAAMENCEKGASLYPCGKCDNCVKIHDGTHTDIIELDAASSAGKVDQVRQLKTEALYNPINTKKKYFILDEIHRASSEALDALLKLIEEPPSHCRFILATTDVQKIKPTILSRCQRHDFKKIYWSKIGDHLTTIVKQEKLEAEQSALNLCAKMSDGSMRSALQHVEHLANFCGNGKMTLAQAQKMFGSAELLQYYGLVDQIIGKDDGSADATEGFRIINSMFAGGADFKQIYSDLVDHLRNLMVGLTSSKPLEFISLSEEGKSRLKDQLTKIQKLGGLESIIESIRKLNSTVVAVEHNLSPETALQHWFLESVFIFRTPRTK